MGITIAMDDFGTGYSSLAYLKKFPVDIIKIDKTFIQGAFDNPEDYNIIKAIIGLGHELRLKIVAEGVEELYQYDFLRASHCSIIQGYLFSKPLPESEFIAYTGEQLALQR
jgi:EAL domain-containing protein (putative c-di-GMP-specific phosphodiesterase class I)